MTKVTFIQPSGQSRTLEASDGDSVMQVAVRHQLPGIDAECGGACSCATCHVYVDEAWLAKLAPPSEVEMAAGLVWRFQSENNYYIVRANAREDNVVLYRVQNGQRTDLPVKGEGRTYGKPSKVPPGRWGTLRVVAKGPRFEIFHDGRKLYEVEDATFTQAGKVGVWTKADSVTEFDDLTMSVVK